MHLSVLHIHAHFELSTSDRQHLLWSKVMTDGWEMMMVIQKRIIQLTSPSNSNDKAKNESQSWNSLLRHDPRMCKESSCCVCICCVLKFPGDKAQSQGLTRFFSDDCAPHTQITSVHSGADLVSVYRCGLKKSRSTPNRMTQAVLQGVVEHDEIKMV